MAFSDQNLVFRTNPSSTIYATKSWPASVFIYRLVYREILLFAHHLVLTFVLWLNFGPELQHCFLAWDGFYIFFSFWVSFIVAIISLRFRTFPPIIQSIMRLAFLHTNIWIERDLVIWRIATSYQPFLWFLKIVHDLVDWI